MHLGKVFREPAICNIIENILIKNSLHFVLTIMAKPIVLHIGEPIKYNQEFYDNEFLSRFQVVRSEETNRQDFIEALKNKK